MAKKLILVWLTLLMVLFSSISIYADENVQGDFFVKNVVINGAKIVNYNLQYPFITYENNNYFPLTPEIGEICGFTAEMDWESRTLKLLKTDSTRKNISSNWMKNNSEDISLNVLSGVTVLTYTDVKEKTEGDSKNIESPKLSVEEMDLGKLPVLMAGEYLYLPVKAMSKETTFDWDVYYNAYYGLCISTIEGVKAQSFCNKNDELANKGLVSYMKHKNGGITSTMGLDYLFMFKRASEVYGVDTKLLMAVASKESTFNAGARSGGGAIGMMQIMPSTAARFGVSKAQLYNAKTNIDFGAMYISQRISAYGGDWIKGLSAYNQGSSKVNRGTHSTAYASRIMTEYNTVNNYLKAMGYAK